jgi:hypothetical protein
MSNISKRVAEHFVARMKAQNVSGTVRDRYAVEFMTGAAAAAVVIHGEDSKEWNALSMAAFMTSVRGYQGLVSLTLKGDETEKKND